MIADKFDLFHGIYDKDRELVENFEGAIKLLVPKNGVDAVLTNCINDNQDKNEQFKKLRSYMPSKTSDLLLTYQNSPNSADKKAVDEEINKIHCKLEKGQQILHGGYFKKKEFITENPLSTTTDPQVAFRENEHNEKAFKNNRIDINILEVKKSDTNVYAFDTEGTDHGDEREILFASGAHIKQIQEIKITDDYEVSNKSEKRKKIPLYLHKLEIS